MVPFRLDGFAGFSLRSSPFEAGLWAVASAANFGVSGKGRLYVLRQLPSRDGTPLLSCVCSFDTNGGLYDCAWSEQLGNHLLAASADGSIELYDTAADTAGRPVMVFSEHQVSFSRDA